MRHRPRLVLYCLRHGLIRELEDVADVPARIGYRTPVVEGRRVYAPHPHFRDASGIPDRCFEITKEVAVTARLEHAALVDGRLDLAGWAHLRLLGGRSTIELRRWPAGRRLRFATEPVATPGLRDREAAYPLAGFRGSIDLGTADRGGALGGGSWTIRLECEASSVRRSAPLRVPTARPRAAVIDAGATRSGPYVLGTGRAGELRLTVGRSLTAGIRGQIDGASRRVRRLGRRMVARVRGRGPRGLRG